MMQNPEIVPEKFRKSYWKTIKSFTLMLGGCSIGGLAINMTVTRMFPRYLTLNPFMRLPGRLAIFSLPFLVSYFKLEEYNNKRNDMVEEQFIKIQRLRRTGNIEEYFE